MGLKDSERKEVVKFRLEKANNTFAEISFLMDNKFYRTAANRLYYACFYVASALLVKDAYEAHTHNGVKTLLGLHYFKENKIDKSFNKLYEKLFTMRLTGDYEDLAYIEEKDIIDLLEPAKEFITVIENMINNND
jgi:uncharacterized protein (UPF0332 family)